MLFDALENIQTVLGINYVEVKVQDFSGKC